MNPNQQNPNQQNVPFCSTYNQNIPPQASFYGGGYTRQPPQGQYQQPYPNPQIIIPGQQTLPNQQYYQHSSQESQSFQSSPSYATPQQGSPLNQNFQSGSIPSQPGYPGYPQQQYQPYPGQYSGYPAQNVSTVPQTGYLPPPSATQTQQTVHFKVDGSKKKNKTKFLQVGPSTPSLRPILNSNPVADARAIYNAFKGIGCDNKTVINILARRTTDARESIKAEYTKIFSKCIVERAKSEFNEPLERLIVSLLLTREHLDAYLLRKATKGIGTDESALIDILCTRSTYQISKIKESYLKQFKSPLEKHISSDTSGSFKNILLTLLKCTRDQSEVVDYNLAQLDASDIYSRKMFKFNAPDNLIDIFCLRSYSSLRATFTYFLQQYGMSIYSFLKQYMNGYYENTLMAICNYVTNPLHYQSKQLCKAIITANINAVIRIVCTRCEIDLMTIIQDYKFMYNKDPVTDIKATFKDTNPDTVYALSILMGC